MQFSPNGPSIKTNHYPGMAFNDYLLYVDAIFGVKSVIRSEIAAILQKWGLR